MKRLFQYDPAAARAAIEVDGERLLPPLGQVVRQVGSLEPEAMLPCALDDDLSLVAYLNSYFRFLRADGVSLGSINSYARDLIVFDRYLAQTLSKDLLSASSADVAEYRILRLEGPSGVRLRGTSWRRAAVSLSRFYLWASDPEVALISRPPKTLIRRDGAKSEATIRFVSMAAYLAFRNEFGRRSAYGGLRNAAFAELLVTSGMRLQEAGSIIVPEIAPYLDKGLEYNRSVMLYSVADYTAKGRKARNVPLSHRVVHQYIKQYMREERAQAVLRWRLSGGVSNLDAPIVAWLQGNGRIAIGANSANRLPSQFTPAERRRLVLLPHEGAPLALAEPASLWLNSNGTLNAPARG